MTMTIERTENAPLLLSILRTEGIAEWVGDDGSEIVVSLHSRIYYLLAKIEIGVEPGLIEERVIGFMAFQPVNGITWVPHVAILPLYRGMGTQALMAGMQWMFANSPCLKLTAAPPEYNKPMVRVFEKCGFTDEGFSKDSVCKNGLLYGRHLFGRGK